MQLQDLRNGVKGTGSSTVDFTVRDFYSSRAKCRKLTSRDLFVYEFFCYKYFHILKFWYILNTKNNNAEEIQISCFYFFWHNIVSQVYC